MIAPGSAQILDGVSGGTVLRADVAVAGSGAGAGAAAGELRRAGLSVLMIEAGPAPSTTRPGVHIRNGFPDEDQLDSYYGPQVRAVLGPFSRPGMPFARLPGAVCAQSVGGMLSYWSHMCAIPDPATEAEPSIPEPEMTPLVHRSLELLWANTDIAAAGQRQKRVQEAVSQAFPGLPAGREVQPFPVSMQRTATGSIEYAGIDALLTTDGSASPGDVSILPGHAVRQVEFSGSRASALIAAPRDGGRTVRIEAQAIVVAGGAIGTPQLLHASGLRMPALGHYLTEHPMMISLIKLRDEFTADVPADDPNFAVWIPASTARDMHTQIARHARSTLAGAPEPADEIDPRLTATITQFTGVDPWPDNYVSFDDGVPDAFGLPTADIHFTLSDADRRRAAGMFTDNYRVIQTLADRVFPVSITLMQPGSSLHLMGTTRIGAADDGTSVTDSNVRVWGYDNLYLAGNGVISTRNAGNPTVNTVALGLRAARAIIAS